MELDILTLCYLIGSVTFILGLKMLLESCNCKKRKLNCRIRNDDCNSRNYFFI